MTLPSKFEKFLRLIKILFPSSNESILPTHV